VGWDAWLTLAVVVVTVGALARNLVSPPLAILGATVLLLVAGVIDPAEAFAGFANPAPITVAALYVLARAVEVTGALEPVVRAVMGRNGPGKSDRRAAPRRTRRQVARLAAPTAAASAFLNNTPVVAMMAPEVREWAKRRGLTASPLLMPISFAAILGGTLTVIGTSTNLVVSGLLQAAGEAPIGMFEITRAGLPLAVCGLVLVALLAPRLLPDRGGARDGSGETMREFSVAMRVVPGGPLDGRTVEEAELRHLQGVYLVQVERDGHAIAPVGPQELLRGGDVLRFVGKLDLIVDLQRKRGLESTEQEHFAGLDQLRQTFYEAVVGAGSQLVGHTLKEAGFRGRYNAAVVAIHRAGQRVDAKLGGVPLRPGDTLLVLGDGAFRSRWRESGDFLTVARLGGNPSARSSKAPLVGAIGLALVVLAGTGLLPILQAALVAAFLLVAVRAVTVQEARDAVDLNVIVVIAAAFGLAAAITKTGLADALAGGLIGGLGPFGELGALAAVIVATVVLTELVTNNAAAALMFPVALSTAQLAGANPRGFAIAVALAASASFLTPIGYQTNTIVYGLGGYRFTDYVRLGLPLTLTMIAVLVLVVPLAWPL
jgi:di/tricarboxylate transporter